VPRRGLGLQYYLSHSSLGANHSFIPHNLLSYFAIALKLPEIDPNDAHTHTHTHTKDCYKFAFMFY